MVALQRGHQRRRIDASISALQLDRARHLAIHRPGENRGRTAVLREGAAGRSAQWYVDSGRRCDTSEKWRGTGKNVGALPHAGLCAVYGRGCVAGNDARGNCGRDRLGKNQRALHKNHRPWRQHHGGQKAGRILLSSNVLRFTTAGNVDDGKSTLIGRLLVETQGAFEDQIEGAKRENERRGGKGIDFSLLTDGLKAEREQGITIDVAYRYFATAKRKFIIADAPGHEQYTRNLVTSASNSDLAVILIDAQNGMMTQSRRHTFIAYLLGIRHFIVAINKMDLVDFRQERYEEIKSDFNDFIKRLGGSEAYCIPISALQGDHVTEQSDRMSWYTGPKLLDLLESIQVDDAAHKLPFRFAVQLVSRPPASPEFPDFRGYMGRVASGSVKIGDRIIVLPSGARSRVTSIVTRNGRLSEALARQSVTLTLADDLDISRGDILSSEDRSAVSLTDFKAILCWMNERKLHLNHRYVLRHTTRTVRAIINEIDYRLNVNTLERESPVSELQTNDIAQVRIKTLQPVVCDPYVVNRQTGGFIIVDENNDTVAAGMIEE